MAGTQSLAALNQDQDQQQRPSDLGARLARASDIELDDMAFWPADRWLAEFTHTTEDGQQYIDMG